MCNYGKIKRKSLWVNKYIEKFGYYPRGWAHGEETMREYEEYLEKELQEKGC